MISSTLIQCNRFVKKRFLNENQLLLDSFKLGVKVYQSGYRPSFIVGLWRGGSEVGIYVQECLQTLGVNSDHLSVRTSYRGAPSYGSMVARPEVMIRVHGTEYLRDNLNVEDQLLIVDDVYSTGLSVQAVKKYLQRTMRCNLPKETKVACLYQRPSFNKTVNQPDFCIEQTENWLVLPYEMSGLTASEIRQHKPYLYPLLLRTE